MKKNKKSFLLAIALILVFVVSLWGQNAAAQDCGFTASSWQLAIGIGLSEEAKAVAQQVLDDYGVPEMLFPTAGRVIIRENYSFRDEDGIMIGNGQRVVVLLMLTVIDLRSPIGPYLYPLSVLFLKGFNTSVDIIRNSIDNEWIPYGNAEDLKSDIVRTHRTQRYEELVHAGEVLTQVDRVEYNLKAKGPAGEVQLQTSYLRRNDPTFFACGDCNNEMCYSIGLCYVDDPHRRLYDFYMRNTAYAIAEQDRINFNLKLRLKDEILARIFEDENNTITGFDEQFRDSLFVLAGP